MSKRWLRRLAVVALLVAAAVTLRFTLFREEAIPVTVFRAARGRVEESVTNSKAGTVKSRRRASLSTEIGGRVALLPVTEGDRVRAGQVLVRLADADYRSQLDLQERSRDAALAAEREACESARQAERDLERNRKLAEDRIVSVAILDQVQTRRDTAASACEAARARARQADSAVRLARVNLGKTVLEAPFDGVVAEVSTELGEWITPSPPGLPIPSVIELIDPEAIYISAPLDEVDVGRVRVGMRARVTMDAYPDRSFAGRVVRVAPYVIDIQEQNRTFEIEVELDDDALARALVPGSSADVEIILDVRENVLRVPSYALIEGSRVLVVRGDRLESVPVETGLRNWEFTEVSSGPDEGELVVVTLDRVEIREGARVRVSRETEK